MLVLRTVIVERDSFVVLDRFQFVAGLELAPVDDARRVAVGRITVQCQRVTDHRPVNLGLAH